MKRFLLSLLLFFPLLLHAVEPVKVYRGTSSYSSDVVCTVRDGKIYKGTSGYSSDVICTVRDSRIYGGNSSYSSDVLAHFSGNLTLAEYIAVLHTLLYVY